MRDFRDWCLHYFPGGSFSGDTYSCKNVFRQEKRASLTITERNQKWFDHGTGEGGDIRFFCHEHGIEAWAGVEPWKESLKRKDAPEPDVKPTEAEAVKVAAPVAPKVPPTETLPLNVLLPAAVWLVVRSSATEFTSAATSARNVGVAAPPDVGPAQT